MTPTPAVPPSEAEALAGVVHRLFLRDGWTATGDDIADAILASDWLREHDARVRAEALLDAAHEVEHSVMPNHPNAGYRDGHAHAAWVVRSLTPTEAPR